MSFITQTVVTAAIICLASTQTFAASRMVHVYTGEAPSCACAPILSTDDSGADLREFFASPKVKVALVVIGTFALGSLIYALKSNSSSGGGGGNGGGVAGPNDGPFIGEGPFLGDGGGAGDGQF